MKKSSRIVSVVLEVKSETQRPRFNVPREVTKILGLKSKDKIALVIREAGSERPLYGGTPKLKSGTEIYDAKDVSRSLPKNAGIRVEASRP
jgi:hypothetical protein